LTGHLPGELLVLIKTIFFDIGGVLLHIHPQRSINYWAEKTGQTAQQVKKLFPLHIHNQYETGKLTEIEFYEKVKEFWTGGKSISERDFWRGWQLLLGHESAAVEILKRLSKTYSIWLLSNTNPRHINREIKDKVSFLPYISGAVYSFEAGYRKPHKEIFEYALRLSGVAGQEAVFIDDLHVNISAAKKIGMHGIVYKDGPGLNGDLHKLGIN